MTKDKTVTMSRELAQFALNAVEYLALRADDIGYSNEPVAAALRAALAAPVVERQPAATVNRKAVCFIELTETGRLLPDGTKLYTSPPAPVAVDDRQSLQDRHDAWVAGVEQGKNEVSAAVGLLKLKDRAPADWRDLDRGQLADDAQDAGYNKAIDDVRACLDKVKELNQ